MSKPGRSGLSDVTVAGESFLALSLVWPQGIWAITWATAAVSFLA